MDAFKTKLGIHSPSSGNQPIAIPFFAIPFNPQPISLDVPDKSTLATTATALSEPADKLAETEAEAGADAVAEAEAAAAD